MKKRGKRWGVDTYAVTGRWLDLDQRPVTADVVELRGAKLLTKESDSTWGATVDIRVEAKAEQIVDQVLVYRPTIRFHGGILFLTGFAQIVRQDGVLVDPRRGAPDAPMRIMEIRMRPEAALSDDGEWLR